MNKKYDQIKTKNSYHSVHFVHLTLSSVMAWLHAAFCFVCLCVIIRISFSTTKLYKLSIDDRRVNLTCHEAEQTPIKNALLCFCYILMDTPISLTIYCHTEI